MGDSIILMLTGTPAAFIFVSFLESPFPFLLQDRWRVGCFKNVFI